MEERLKRSKDQPGEVGAYVPDRAFDAQSHRERFEEEGIYNAVCPCDPRQLQEQSKDPRFMERQQRPRQTKARIGFFKNACLGSPIKNKGYAHKKRLISWAVRSHNRWVLGRMARSARREQDKAA